MTKNKTERRFIAIARILRKRNYGYQKVLKAYTDSIYRTVYSKTRTDKIARQIHNNLKGTSGESLDSLYSELNKKLEKFFPQIKRYIQTFLNQGSAKVFDAKGQALTLKKPKYTKELEKLAENNLKYVKGILEDQRKVMVNEISKGIKDGKTYAQMADAIVAKVENVSRNRALLIAQNESQVAHTKAQEDTMKLNGITKYQWVTAQDERVSPICQSLHRKVFAFGKTGKMNWRDTEGKVHNISKSPRPIRDSHIRCRCIQITVLD